MRDFFIIIVGLAALAIVWGGWQVWRGSIGGAVACTADARLCPDGSAVGRTGPRCEFAPCPPGPTDYRDAVYMLDGVPTKLGEGGVAYFGNEAAGDLNGDGVSDVALLITYDGGGSGTFYYAVAALKTDTGYQGTNAILLGDRIAPQTTEYRAASSSSTSRTAGPTSP